MNKRNAHKPSNHNQRHHTIPISLQWPDTKENIITIWQQQHTELHHTQDISYKILREYRQKTNEILIPTDYSLQLKGDLWKEFFNWMKVLKMHQCNSVFEQLKLYRKRNRIYDTSIPPTIELMLDEIIQHQREIIAREMMEYNTNKKTIK